MRQAIVTAVGLAVSCLASPTWAADGLPVAQQNALVQKHCAVCHNDHALNGGLSLQHFDATEVAPSLAAMMLSKLTSGLPLDTVVRAFSDQAARGQLEKRLLGGAIMAAGITPPDLETTIALSAALAARSRNASAWHVSRVDDPVTKTSQTTASVLREVARRDETAESYRLVLTCDAGSRKGHMQLAWSPVPTVGTFSIVVDGLVRGPYTVEGKEAMGNGIGSSKGLAAFSFPGPLFPSRALVVQDLFPNEAAEFLFDRLSSEARRSLAPCFDEK